MVLNNGYNWDSIKCVWNALQSKHLGPACPTTILADHTFFLTWSNQIHVHPFQNIPATSILWQLHQILTSLTGLSRVWALRPWLTTHIVLCRHIYYAAKGTIPCTLWCTLLSCSRLYQNDRNICSLIPKARYHCTIYMHSVASTQVHFWFE